MVTEKQKKLKYTQMTASIMKHLPRVAGAWIMFLVAEDYKTSVSDLANNLSPIIWQLEAEGLWRHMETRSQENYFRGKKGLVYFIEVVK